MPDPTERLIASTRRRLAWLTLGLLATLLVAMGLATLLVAVNQLDSATDAALTATAHGVLSSLEGQLPATTGGEGESETSDEPVGSADTFVLVLDHLGTIVQNPRNVHLAGLPDAAALAVAMSGGSDLRTMTAGGLPIRLETLAIHPPSGGPATGVVQAGLILTLHDQQVRDLERTIVLVGLVGLACSTLLALLLTGRALVPIRAAFATERRFVAAASHELRTPAAIIRASAEVLQREGLVQDEGSSLVTGLVAEADRLSRLVVELLALSSSRADPDAVQLAPADLAEIVLEAVSRIRPLADERGCKLGLSTSPAPELPILGDADRLLQVLVILLDNATRLAPSGTAVDVRLGRGDRLAWFSVDDHGPGVAVEDRLRVFEPFARAGAGRRQRREGTGLGLAVARSLVDRHHGTISVDDAPGGGARFTVSLPLR